MSATPVTQQMSRTDCANHEKLMEGIRLLVDPLRSPKFHIQAYIQNDIRLGGHRELVKQRWQNRDSKSSQRVMKFIEADSFGQTHRVTMVCVRGLKITDTSL